MLLKSKNIKMIGSVTIKKFDGNKRLIQKLEIPNLVVTSGKDYIASRIMGTSSDVMSHMAVGSNNTAPTVSNTSLVSELARVELDDVTLNGSIIIYSATFGPGVGSGSLSEAGIFNANTSGTMLCRTTFPVILKGGAETIAITWNVSVG